jgi:triosephosphate isomerase
MYKTTAESRTLVQGLKEKALPAGVEVVLCPPFTALATVAQLITGTEIGLGAQDLFWAEEGAYTGEISPVMLKELGCTYVIIGHSERRQYFGETDESVNKKAQAALEHGLKPIICVGESLEQREAGETDAFVSGQVKKALAGLAPASIPQVVIAYEPIWAIGTGRSSSSDDANQVIALIRQTIADQFTSELANQVRIQYGGSVKPENITEYMAQPEIDGALVGGASLKAESFYGILSY